ncbi:hypothetical protein E1301_Tti006165 [Triplophysa tibetana]|uniref:Pyrin domain-containing protein n=1 Tax=Triplophysa tibetana TaxID=1572043 RepID=A0A5A9NRJ8_9TELE|nr:hypothetical protein E1301_Tti006165 [Triplophysa tibetana]
MMASVRELLVNSLRELKKDQLKAFQWHLKDLDGISTSELENADVLKTVEKIVERYKQEEAVIMMEERYRQGAVKITLDILRKMNQNQLAEKLVNKHKEDTEKRKQVELKEFQWRLRNLDGVTSSDLENTDVLDTEDKMVEHDGAEEAVKITQDNPKKINQYQLDKEQENKHKEDLENADVLDTVDKMVEHDGAEEAVKITQDNPRKMIQNQLTEKLVNKHKEGAAAVDSKAVDYSEFSNRLKSDLKQKYERIMDEPHKPSEPLRTGHKKHLLAAVVLAVSSILIAAKTITSSTPTSTTNATSVTTMAETIPDSSSSTAQTLAALNPDSPAPLLQQWWPSLNPQGPLNCLRL